MESGYELVLIEGYPYLLGDAPLIDEALFDLQVGGKVKSIGALAVSGVETSSARQDEFKTFVTYIGCFKTPDGTFAAFKVPKNEVDGWELFDEVKDVHILYGVSVANRELYRYNYTDQTIRIYPGIFQKTN